MPEYPTKGRQDILNRGNLLTLFKKIPELKGITSRDLLAVEFQPTAFSPDTEESLTTWTSKELVDRIYATRTKFEAWGITLRIHKRPKYPYLLLQSTAIPKMGQMFGKDQKSCLHGASNTSPPAQNNSTQKDEIASPLNFKHQPGNCQDRSWEPMALSKKCT